MALTLRNVKGSPLTYTEMDNNLTYLEGLTTGSTASDLASVLSIGNETDGNNIIMSDNDVINAENGGGQLDLRYGADNSVMLSTDAGGFNEQGLNLEAGYVTLFDYSTGGYLETFAEETIISADSLLRLDTNVGTINISQDNVTGLNRIRLSAPFVDVNLGTTGTRRLRVSGLSTYANNADAIAGGLTTDMIYKTSGGELRIVV
jgi:hypothetical protein